MTFHLRFSLLVATLAVLVSGCAVLNQFAKDAIQKPTVQVTGSRMTALNFSGVDLMFDLTVDNPNGIGISLAGFDYGVLVNGNSLVSGAQSDGLRIEAGASQAVQIPVTLQFADLYNAVSDLRNRDTTAYELQAGFAFDLPVLGAVRVPVKKTGGIPLLKLPKVTFGGVRLENLNFTSANLALTVDIENPNGFAFDLNALNYDFAVNGKTWGTGVSREAMTITRNGVSSVTVPIRLNFLDIGTSVYQLIQGGRDLNYQLSGDVNLGSTIPLLQDLDLDFNRSGDMQIRR